MGHIAHLRSCIFPMYIITPIFPQRAWVKQTISYTTKTLPNHWIATSGEEDLALDRHTGHTLDMRINIMACIIKTNWWWWWWKEQKNRTIPSLVVIFEKKINKVLHTYIYSYSIWWSLYRDPAQNPRIQERTNMNLFNMRMLA